MEVVKIVILKFIFCGGELIVKHKKEYELSLLIEKAVKHNEEHDKKDTITFDLNLIDNLITKNDVIDMLSFLQNNTYLTTNTNINNIRHIEIQKFLLDYFMINDLIINYNRIDRLNLLNDKQIAWYLVSNLLNKLNIYHDSEDHDRYLRTKPDLVNIIKVVNNFNYNADHIIPKGELPKCHVKEYKNNDVEYLRLPQIVFWVTNNTKIFKTKNVNYAISPYYIIKNIQTPFRKKFKMWEFIKTNNKKYKHEIPKFKKEHINVLFNCIFKLLIINKPVVFKY
jgi:hypothetical protein